MADYRAIMGVSEAIMGVLRSSYRPDLFNNELEFAVFTSKDFTNNTIANGASLFMYRIFCNGTHRLPAGRLRTDRQIDQAQLPVELHFLITVWGNDASLQNTLAGWIMRILEDTPTLPAGVLNSVIPGVFHPDETVDILLAELRTEDLFEYGTCLGLMPTNFQFPMLRESFISNPSNPFPMRIIHLSKHSGSTLQYLMDMLQLDLWFLGDHNILYQILETITNHTCLGIRFWDPATGKQIREGLLVTAHPATAPHPVKKAFCTQSNIYAFKGLPGLREIEQGVQEDLPYSSPPGRKAFVVEVRDQHRRYVDAGFNVELPLPYKGLYLSNQSSSPPSSVPRGFNLYSSLMRPPPPMYASVRGELFDCSAGRPASHGMICVHTEDGYHWYGLADAHGRFVTLMPYPTIINGISGSPSAHIRKFLYQQTWQLSIEIRYAPFQVQSLPYSDLKDYSSVLNQACAQIWSEPPESGGTAVCVKDVQLHYGKDVVLKTAGLSKLMVSPAVSPPS